MCVPTAGRRKHTLKSNGSLERGFGADPDGDHSPDCPSTGTTRGKSDKTVPLTRGMFHVQCTWTTLLLLMPSRCVSVHCLQCVCVYLQLAVEPTP